MRLRLGKLETLKVTQARQKPAGTEEEVRYCEDVGTKVQASSIRTLLGAPGIATRNLFLTFCSFFLRINSAQNQTLRLIVFFFFARP